MALAHERVLICDTAPARCCIKIEGGEGSGHEFDKHAGTLADLADGPQDARLMCVVPAVTMKYGPFKYQNMLLVVLLSL